MVRIFLYGIATGMLLSSSGRKKIAAKGIRVGNKISRYVRETSARLKEDWEDAVVEAKADIAKEAEVIREAEIVKDEHKPSPAPQKPPQSS